MTKTLLKRAAKASAKPAALVPPRAPAKTDFKAECDALAAAVAENLETVLRPKPKTAARKAVTAAMQPGSDPGGTSRAAQPPVQYPGEMEFVPAYSFIMKHAGAAATGDDGSDEVTVSRRLLEFLLRCVLDHIDFDEQQYQQANLDVATAIKQKKIHSGREHFIRTGYFEGRSGGVRVDEAWYLARNPDVAAAKKAGKIETAASQYRSGGAREWRVPNQQSEDAVRMWKIVLER
jgi:hypothetical protein